MRVFNAEQGKIVRKLPEGVLASSDKQANKIEAKILAAALDLLKESDDELGKIVGDVLDAALKKVGTQLSASDKQQSAAIERVRDAVREIRFDDGAIRELIGETRKAILAAVARTASSHQEISAQIDGLERTLTAEIRQVRADTPKAPEPAPKAWTIKVERGADGKIKEAIAKAG